MGTTTNFFFWNGIGGQSSRKNAVRERRSISLACGDSELYNPLPPYPPPVPERKLLSQCVCMCVFWLCDDHFVQPIVNDALRSLLLCCGFDQMTKLIIFCLNGFRSGFPLHTTPCSLPLTSLPSWISPSVSFSLSQSLSGQSQNNWFMLTLASAVWGLAVACATTATATTKRATTTTTTTLDELLCLSPKGAINQAKCERTFCVSVSVLVLVRFSVSVSLLFFCFISHSPSQPSTETEAAAN